MVLMRFHIVGLPHTQMTSAFSACAYTQKVVRLCQMLQGDTVILYGAGDPEPVPPCSEYVSCLSEADRKVATEGKHYTEASWDPNDKHWRIFNRRVIAEITQRLQPGDIICVFGGDAQREIGTAFEPISPVVEAGVGYGGVFAKYRVFESYAWMHTVYGRTLPGPLNSIQGQFLDAVIPNQVDPDLFSFQPKPSASFLFMGRLTMLKGFEVVQRVCEAMKLPLVLAGPGKAEGYGEFIGEVGPTARDALLGSARAVFLPTLYVEPFGTVAIEAMACGTPVITTDFGAFTETVIDGVTGFRCRTFAEFCEAARNVEKLDRAAIREYAINRFGISTVGRQYRDYFKRLQLVLKDGWYALPGDNQ
jgi:glycosyltransferase involved in cell wall biosynthesis